MNECIILSERLKNRRIEQKMTQTDLGKAVGLSDATISAYEKGKRLPDAMTALRIACALHVPLDYLCNFTDAEYSIFVPKDIELNLHKLNAGGIKKLCEYYRYICSKDEYLAKSIDESIL